MSAGGFDLDRRALLAIGAAAGIAGLPRAAGAAVPVALPVSGRDQPFEDGWLFRRGAGAGQEAPGLDDGDWRALDLPHDWSIEDIPGAASPFDKAAIGAAATGFTVGGEGWYRKHFRLTGAAAGDAAALVFDGIYCESDIWLNGQHLAANVAGYRPFAVDLTPALIRDGDNVLAIRVRNLGRNSRWYAGSGIYRRVSLDVIPAGARIARWGVGASTRAITGGAAHVAVTTRLDAADPALTLVTRLRDGEGRIVAERASPAAPGIEQELVVRGARLWSPGTPHLYTLETELRRGDRVIDRLHQPFGIRIITMDADRGLQINGARTVLRGGCIHHDNGLLGARDFAEATSRKLALLKARGFNAIRSSHNIPSRSLREACDRLGMLLIAEAFDAWTVAKLPQDFSVHFRDDWEEVVEAMVLSGRNSPSVFLWSIGNEIPGRNSDEGVEWQWKLANRVRSLDPTRPVTAALNGVIGQAMVAGPQTARPGMAGMPDNASTIFLDVPGFNYRLDAIEREHPAHPARVVYGSETFPRDAWDYARLAERLPYCLGEFVWTAVDYLGEAGVGASEMVTGDTQQYMMPSWPWLVSWCGNLDLTGAQKPPSLFRDVAWQVSALEVCVAPPVPAGSHEFSMPWGWPEALPSWSWPGAEGSQVTATLYTSGDRVELRCNGARVAARSLTPGDRGRVALPVTYQPGVLEALAWRDGRIIGRRRLETVGAAARLRLVPEAPGAGATRQSLAFIGVEVLDAAGRVLPQDERALRLTLSGPAELVAFGSAAPEGPRSFSRPETRSFRGRALAILRAQGAGEAVISVAADGLAGDRATVRFG
ncbi:MAG: DUF4982 domain-containing protein [Sphingomonadales bacterium]|nr:DUF4982 domain-containing protein [Sphingomonadales bacterium]